MMEEPSPVETAHETSHETAGQTAASESADTSAEGSDSPKKRGRWRSWRRHALRRIRNAFAGWFGPPLLRLWIGSIRFRWLGDVHLREGTPSCPTPGIYLVWHQSIIGLAVTQLHSGCRLMISDHGDGELIARIVRGLGLQPVRGSTTRGGSKVLLDVLRDDKSKCLSITPDGPRGPLHSVSLGGIYLASRSQMPIYIVLMRYARFKSLPTWDRFILPAPLTRCVISVGDAIRVPPDLKRDALEEIRADIERQMLETTTKLEQEFEALWKDGVPTKDLPLQPASSPCDSPTADLQ